MRALIPRLITCRTQPDPCETANRSVESWSWRLGSSNQYFLDYAAGCEDGDYLAAGDVQEHFYGMTVAVSLCRGLHLTVNAVTILTDQDAATDNCNDH